MNKRIAYFNAPLELELTHETISELQKNVSGQLQVSGSGFQLSLNLTIKV